MISCGRVGITCRLLYKHGVFTLPVVVVLSNIIISISIIISFFFIVKVVNGRGGRKRTVIKPDSGLAALASDLL